MIGRLRYWLRYRRALAASLCEHEAAGYDVSPPALDRLRRKARMRAGS